MQLRRPTRFVLGVGVSNCCLFRRISLDGAHAARCTLHEASENISLVSNPSFSKSFDQNMLCNTQLRCHGHGWHKSSRLWRLGKEKGRIGHRQFRLFYSNSLVRTTKATAPRISRSLFEWLSKNLAAPNSPSTVISCLYQIEQIFSKFSHLFILLSSLWEKVVINS